MLTDEVLLSKAKKLIEAKVGWGDSIDWTNQDFLALSKKIQEEIEVSVSHVTLKRIWGKVRYDSLPNTYTLSTLVQFLGYENWRDFKVKNGSDPMIPGISAERSESANQNKSISGPKANTTLLKPILFTAVLIGLAICIVLFSYGAKKKINPSWIPDHIFWTYFTAVSLIGSGVAIILKIRLKAIGILLGTMIFLWFVFLHIPRAIANPFRDKGNEVTSVFEALAFSGIAFIIACEYWSKKDSVG